MVPWPDSYRALDNLEGEALADAYVSKVAEAVDSFKRAGIKLAGMLICPIFANEGLPVIPSGYLEKAIDPRRTFLGGCVEIAIRRNRQAPACAYRFLDDIPEPCGRDAARG